MDEVRSEALAWARSRARGLERKDAGRRTPVGMSRLIEPGGDQVWWVPGTPDDVTPAVLHELGMSPPTVERSVLTCEVLACCLRLCWTDFASSPWPGIPTSVGAVTDVRALLRPTQTCGKLRDGVTEVARRLSASGWLLWDEDTGVIRLGARVATWPQADLDQFAEICRTLPRGRSESSA
ncbi:hypothetical protein [Saccharopolyspora hattusasensis]|uniref:hypothetical protein n=1 Tax=Saccharopolyspora hattusasensis TaxID=1128679 RepID=UPI003D97690B